MLRVVVPALLVIMPSIGGASIDPLPPIRQETLRCVWEGISEEEPRAFRLIVPRDPAKQGTMLVAIGSPGHVLTMSFSVRSAVVRRGQVMVDAVDESGTRTSVEGPGWAFHTCEGLIKATIKLYPDPGTKYGPSTWRATLHARDQGGFFQRVLAEVAALDAISKPGEASTKPAPANKAPQPDGTSRRR
jgi:hypothetical protein